MELMPETLVSESLYGDEFTLSIYRFILDVSLPHWRRIFLQWLVFLIDFVLIIHM